MKAMDPKWRSDENIILILCAIVLFTPDRPRVVHQDVIKLEQVSFFFFCNVFVPRRSLGIFLEEFVLLPPEEVSGERLCGMRGEIDVPQADTEDRRASQVERGCHQRLPGHEPFGRGTIAHRDFRSKALVLSL